MDRKKESPQTLTEATGNKGIYKDTKRKRIRKYELVTKWKNPVKVLERGAI